MLFRTLARLALPVSLALAAASLGCSGATAEPPASADSAVTRAPVAPGAHGPVKLVGEALGDVPLTAAQRAEIEQLATEAEGRHAASHAARSALLVAVAAQVDAGVIDRAALKPQVDALTAAVQAAQPADRAAFERLHAILGPDQRTAFVDAVKSHFKAHMGEVRDKHPLRKWAADLQLTEDQMAQIRAALGGDHEGWRGHEGGPRGGRGAKVIEAFAQDRFVFAEVAPPEAGRTVGAMSDRFLDLAERVVPILTPEQRAVASQRLRQRAADLDSDALF